MRMKSRPTPLKPMRTRTESHVAFTRLVTAPWRAGQVGDMGKVARVRFMISLIEASSCLGRLGVKGGQWFRVGITRSPFFLCFPHSRHGLGSMRHACMRVDDSLRP